MPKALLPHSTSPTGAPSDLTDRQSAFVKSYLDFGGRDGVGKAAAIAAGYSEKGAAQKAYSLLRMPKILHAIRSELEARFRSDTVLARDVLRAMAERGHPDSVKVAAAKELLDRGGMAITKQVDHQHTHTLANVSTKDLQARAAALLAGLSTEERKMLGIGADVVDAEFTEITDTTDDEIDFATVVIEPGAKDD